MGSALGVLAALAVFPVPLPGTSQPAWSPDASRVAFVEARGKPGAATKADIYVALIGTRAMSPRLTRGGGFNTAPAWSPDARVIAYVRTSYNRRRGALMLMRSDGRGKRVLLTGLFSRPAWSPDGRRLAVVRDGELLLVSSRDGATSDVGPAPGTDPAWSPDGALIAFAGSCTLYVVDVVSRATYPGPGLGCIPELTVGSPSWVDGGARIAFSVCELWRRCRLAFAPRLPTGQGATVTFSYVGPDTAWSRDGYRLAWSCIEKGRTMLFLQDLRLRGLQPDCD